MILGMKILIVIFLLHLSSLEVSSQESKNNLRRLNNSQQKNLFLVAIALVETGNNNKLVGKLGEKSAWQIRPSTWKQFSKLPLNHSRNESLRVARCYLDYIICKKKTTDVRTLAIYWNAGPWCKSVSKQTKNYAERVENIYDNLYKTMR